MPVTIEEVSAEVLPPSTKSSPAKSSELPARSVETETREFEEMLKRLAHRAARLHAD